MRLIILFSQNECVNARHIRANDIIVASKKCTEGLELPNKIIHIETLVPYSVSFRDAASQAKRHFYEKNKLNAAQKQAIDATYNILYNHIVGTAFKYIQCVKATLLQFPTITEIVLSDWVDAAGYLPLYEAEGEINRKLFYQAYDFIPDLIKKHFEQKYKLSYLKKRSKLGLKTRIFLRRYILLGLKLAMHTWLQVKSIFSAKISTKHFKNVTYVFATRGVAHTHYFMPICKALRDEALIHISDSLNTAEHNAQYARKKLAEHRVVLQREHLSFRDYLNALQQIWSLISSRKYIKTPLVIEGVQFSIRSAFVEMSIYLLEVFLHQKSLEKLVAELAQVGKKCCIITGEMLTPYPVYVHEIAAKYPNIRSLQLQTTLMMLYPQTRFAHAEVFVFKGYKEWEYFTKTGGAKEKYKFWGSLLQESATEARHLKKVVFFTQPYQNEEEKEVLTALLALSEQLNFELAIKFHPRENPKKYQAFEGKFRIIPAGEQLEDYLFDYDCAVLRTSSIAHEIIQYNIPIVFPLFGEESKQAKGSYLSHDYVGTVFDALALKLFLQPAILL
ncbi:MAG: hypothetical protein AAF738_05595 [Bacteroidota bacterium]